MFKRTFNVSAAALLTVIALAPQAIANCAMPVSYVAKVSGSTVTVAPQNYGERGCPDSSGMLRENVATGELVKLADYCSGTTTPGTATTSATSAAYVDECVPPGSYRYGFATPYSCHGSACATDYFTAASVESTLASGCTRSTGNSPPTSANTKPWTNVTAICNYQYSNPVAAGGFSSTGTGGMLNGAPGGGAPNVGGSSSIVAPLGGQNSTGGAVAATGGASSGGKSSNNEGGSTITTEKAGSAGKDTDTDAKKAPAESDSGCSIAAPTATSTVIAVNLTTILIGLMLGRRRRNRIGARP